MDKHHKHMGLKEASEYLGMTKHNLLKFIERNPGWFPEPDDIISATPIWHEETLKQIKHNLSKGGAKQLRISLIKTFDLTDKQARTKAGLAKRRHIMEEAKRMGVRYIQVERIAEEPEK